MKTLVIFILDSSDDRYAGYLKQIDTVRKNYPELYVVILVSGLVRESYVEALETYPVLNKCNIIAADNGVVEKYLSQHPGKPFLAILQDDIHDDFLKFTQAIDERFTEKEVNTPQEIIFKGQKCQYL